MQAKTDKGNKSPNNTENHKKNYRNSKKRQISPTYILKCASVLFAVFFILLSCLILIYPNTDNARKIIQTQINKAIPGSIAFEKLHFSLFSGSLELENISLMDLSNKKIADIKRIFIEVSWKSLLQNEIYIKTAEIVKPQIQLVIGKKGQINLESAFISPEQTEPSSNKPEKSEKLAFNIILKKFELSDGQLNCQIPDKQFIGKIPDINFNISNFNLNNLTGLLALKTDKGSFQTPDIKGIIKKCQLNATLKDGKIKPLFLNLGTTGLNIELSGAINNLLKNSNTQPNLALKIKTDISLSEINKMIIKNNANTQLPLRKINGNIKLVASILGNINRPVIKIDLQGKQFIFQDITIGDMGIYASLDNSGKLSISDMFLKNKKSVITGNGDVQILKKEGLQLADKLLSNFKLVLNNIYLKDFFANQDSSGAINGKLKIKGDLYNPQVNFLLQGKNMAVENFTVGDVDLDVDFSKGTLQVHNVEFKNKKSNLNIQGSIVVLHEKTMKPLKAPLLDLTLKESKLFLQDYMPGKILPEKVVSEKDSPEEKPTEHNPENIQNIKGQFALSGHIGGSTEKPSGELKIKGEKIDLGVQKIQEIELFARIKDKDIFIDKFLAMIAQKEEISGNGMFSLKDSSYKLDISSTPISLKNINYIEKQKTAQGKIVVNVRGEGTINSPQLNGEIKLTKLSVNKMPLDDIELNINIKEQLFKIWGKPGFDLQAQYQIDSKDFSASVQFDNTNLAPYFEIAKQTRFNGNITGDIKASGNINRIENIKANAVFSNINLTLDKQEFLQTKNINIKLEDNKFVILKADMDIFKEGQVNISGSGDINGKVDIMANGSIPLKIITAFSDQIQKPVGSINFSVNLKESFAKPDIQAKIKINKLGGTISELNDKLHDFSGEIEITHEIVKLNGINGKIGTGSFNINGKIDLNKFKPVKMKIKADAKQLSIKIPDTMNILLDSQILLEGTEEQSTLSGDVTLLNGLYYKDLEINLLELTQKKREIAPVPTDDKSNSFLKNVKLNVNITNKQAFVIDNNIALLSLKPNLKIYGTADNPVVSGQAVVTKGVITFRDNEFKIKKGVVNFVNPYRTVPEVVFSSQVKIRKWTIILDISGVPDNLNFKFSSTPQESDADIISLITFGKTTYERSDGTKTSTKQVIANVVADEVSDSIKKITGLDTVEMDVKDGENNEPDDVTVTIGKNLSRRISVSLGVEISDGKTVQQVNTQYKIFEPLRINVYQNTEGEYGGELQYKYEFR